MFCITIEHKAVATIVLNILQKYYQLIIKRITRRIISLCHIYVNKEILCKCLLECKDEILVFTNFTSLILISTMIALLVILFIIKLYTRNNTFKLPTSCFGLFWTCLATSIKKDNTNLWKLWHLSACQKLPLFLTSFLRYCKDIENLLLWVIWECLIIPINHGNNNLEETLMPKVLK